MIIWQKIDILEQYDNNRSIFKRYSKLLYTTAKLCAKRTLYNNRGLFRTIVIKRDGISPYAPNFVGGSIAKVVYRSKQEYSGGKRKEQVVSGRLIIDLFDIRVSYGSYT